MTIPVGLDHPSMPFMCRVAVAIFLLCRCHAVFSDAGKCPTRASSWRSSAQAIEMTMHVYLSTGTFQGVLALHAQLWCLPAEHDALQTRSRRPRVNRLSTSGNGPPHSSPASREYRPLAQQSGVDDGGHGQPHRWRLGARLLAVMITGEDRAHGPHGAAPQIGMRVLGRWARCSACSLPRHRERRRLVGGGSLRSTGGPAIDSALYMMTTPL